MNLRDRDDARDAAQQAARGALASLPHAEAEPAFRARLRAEFAQGEFDRDRMPRRSWRWAWPGTPRVLGLRWGLGMAAVVAAVLLLNVLNRGPAWEIVSMTGPLALRVDGQPVSVGAGPEDRTFLAPGARVQVPAGAELTLVSRRTLLLQGAGGSDFVLPGSPGRWWGRRSVGRLQAGEVRFTTGAAFAGATLQMTTPEATVQAVGTTFAVIALPCVTCVCVYDGGVLLRPLGGSFESVPAPQRKMVFSDGRPAVVGQLEPDERAKLGMIRDAGQRMLGGGADAREGRLDFELPRQGGGTVSLAALRAKGPVIVDFWATWCAPCLRALPRYQILQERYGAQGVTFVAISEDDPRSQSKIGPYMQAQGLTLAVALDGDGRVAKQFGVTELPTTFVFSSQGEVVAKHVGYQDGDEGKLEQEIRAQLALPAEPQAGPGSGSD